MKLHGNARLSVKGRELLIDRVEHAGWSLSSAAEAAGISDRTARKWLARYRARAPQGCWIAPQHRCCVANRTDERRVEVIAALRRLRLTGLEIAECLRMAHSTVSGILTRIGMGKLGRLGLEPAQRYERQRPGELIHIDVKKLGRIRRRRNRRVTGSRGVPPRMRAKTHTSAGSTCTSRSTTRPAWPTSKSSPTRRPPPRSVSYAAPSRTTPATASPCERLHHR